MLSHLIYTGFIMKYSVYKESATLRAINPDGNRLKLHTPAGFQDHPVWNGPPHTHTHGRANHYRLSHLLTGRDCKLHGKSFARVFSFFNSNLKAFQLRQKFK